MVPLPTASRQEDDFRFISHLPAGAQPFPMPLLKRLTHPFALVAEGFVVGALLFASSNPNLMESHSAAPRPLDSSVIPNPSR
jgi:hypothetical protein